jgi:hypothetical protein
MLASLLESRQIALLESSMLEKQDPVYQLDCAWQIPASKRFRKLWAQVEKVLPRRLQEGG